MSRARMGKAAVTEEERQKQDAMEENSKRIETHRICSYQSNQSQDSQQNPPFQSSHTQAVTKETPNTQNCSSHSHAQSTTQAQHAASCTALYHERADYASDNVEPEATQR